MLLICKECYEKKYGTLSTIFYYECDEQRVCFVCGKKKKMVKHKYPPKKIEFFRN